MTETAKKLKEARSKHLLPSYEDAVKQFAVFREATPITEMKSPYSGGSLRNSNLSSIVLQEK